jgi:hypothetical protein
MSKRIRIAPWLLPLALLQTGAGAQDAGWTVSPGLVTATVVQAKIDEAESDPNEGKAVFVLSGKGWKVAAKLTGSRYWPDDELNAR